MNRDTRSFKERFKRWKLGDKVYESGRPIPAPARQPGDMYDYQRAAELGYERDNTGHFSTRDYLTGRYLKNATHPTVMMSVVSDLGEGYYPYYNKKDGLIYSDTWMKLPRYEGGKDDTPMLDRLFYEDGDKVLDWKTHVYRDLCGEKMSETDIKKESLNEALRHPVYFDAGMLPEVIIRPRKDYKTVLYKAKEMIPWKPVREKWYKTIDNNFARETFNYPDMHDYISRVYNVYQKTGKPRIGTTTAGTNVLLWPFIGKHRDNYNAFFNMIHIDPEDPLLEDELSHAFLYKYPGVPTGGWSLPGDIKIKGKSGYDRPGHTEYIAHSIIQPVLDQYYKYGQATLDDVVELINDMNNYPQSYGLE